MIRFLLASATFLFLSLVSAPSAVEIGYTATDLGSVTGVALNDRGQVVGWQAMGNCLDITFISGPDGVGIRSLGALSGDRFSHATGINNSGQVTGFSELHPTDEDHLGIPHAFLSEPNGGPLHDIASLAGAESAGRGVNNVGQVTGYAILPMGLHAFLSGVNGGAIKDLGNFNGPGGYTIGAAVNDTGQVAGISNFTLPNGGGATHAFLSGENGGLLKDLGTLPGGELFSQAQAVNNLGQVSGSSALLFN